MIFTGFSITFGKEGLLFIHTSTSPCYFWFWDVLQGVPSNLSWFHESVWLKLEVFYNFIRFEIPFLWLDFYPVQGGSLSLSEILSRWVRTATFLTSLRKGYKRKVVIVFARDIKFMVESHFAFSGINWNPLLTRCLTCWVLYERYCLRLCV
jgi:hypothetical protein